MRTIEEIVQEIVRTGQVTPMQATRRDIAKMLQRTKPRHHHSTKRLMQHTKEEPKHAVRNAFTARNVVVTSKRPPGQKMDPWQ